jgi:hypothetical protein
MSRCPVSGELRTSAGMAHGVEFICRSFVVLQLFLVRCPEREFVFSVEEAF